jgi:uncharacterized protein DUF4157
MGQLATLLPQRAAKPDGAARLLQRACACAGKDPGQGECETCKRKRVQRKGAGAVSDANGAADLASFERGGRPLARAWRERLEPLFGVDFSAVRLHDDGASHAAARDLRAHAFTLGQHIHFAHGQFRPGARDGLHLLAHELTHTVQQRGSSADVATDAVDVDASDSAFERDADAAADAIIAGRAPALRPGIGGASVQRRLQRKGEAEGTRTRQIDADTSVTVTRSLIERRCRRVEDTQGTPRKDVFFWDDDAKAVGLRYKICRGKVQLSSGVTIDYSDVERAAKDLLRAVGSNPAGGTATSASRSTRRWTSRSRAIPRPAHSSSRRRSRCGCSSTPPTARCRCWPRRAPASRKAT